MFYPYPEWQDDPQFVYLGSEANPATKFRYDYWVANTCTGITFLARHGTDPSDYGSSPIFLAYYDHTSFDQRKDYHFGMERARQLGLYYLVTREKPLLRELP